MLKELKVESRWMMQAGDGFSKTNLEVEKLGGQRMGLGVELVESCLHLLE